VIDHNTVVAGRDLLFFQDTGPYCADLVFTNNVVVYGSYGTGVSDTQGHQGFLPTLNANCPRYTFRNNVIVARPGSDTAPPANYDAASLAACGFVNYAGGDYRLAPTSPFFGLGWDGTTPGTEVA
jgi:hypothetical protein